MTRLTAKDFPQELLELYDYYAHGRITKREFLDRAGKFAVGGLTAAGILATLSPTTRWRSRCRSPIRTSRPNTSPTHHPMGTGR